NRRGRIIPSRPSGCEESPVAKKECARCRGKGEVFGLGQCPDCGGCGQWVTAWFATQRVYVPLRPAVAHEPVQAGTKLQPCRTCKGAGMANTWIRCPDC